MSRSFVDRHGVATPVVGAKPASAAVDAGLALDDGAGTLVPQDGRPGALDDRWSLGWDAPALLIGELSFDVLGIGSGLFCGRVRGWPGEDSAIHVLMVSAGKISGLVLTVHLYLHMPLESAARMTVRPHASRSASPD